MPNDLISTSDLSRIHDLKRSFDERLDSIVLNDNEAEKEINKVTKNLIRDKLAGLFKITDLANTVLKWGEETDKALKNIKKEKLIETYFQLTENANEGLSRIRDFLSSPAGNILFNKIIALTEDSPPEKEMIGHLATALYNVAFSDFEALFDEHRHALSQIGRLTSQALTILSDAKSWPRFQLSSHTTDGGIVRSEWNQEFSSAYAATKRVGNDKAIVRIGHSIFELQTARLIIAAKDESEDFRCYYTAIGNEIRKYLQLPRRPDV